MQQPLSFKVNNDDVHPIPTTIGNDGVGGPRLKSYTVDNPWAGAYTKVGGVWQWCQCCQVVWGRKEICTAGNPIAASPLRGMLHIYLLLLRVVGEFLTPITLQSVPDLSPIGNQPPTARSFNCRQQQGEAGPGI